MGKWKLAQCREIADADRQWSYDAMHQGTPVVDRPSFTIAGDDPMPGARALRLLDIGPGLILKASVPKADLSMHRALSEALAGLRSSDPKTFQKAKSDLAFYYRAVQDSLSWMLTMSNTHLYSDEVKISALFLAGEYRIQDAKPLLENVGVRDEKGIARGYTSILETSQIDPTYPAVVALVKCRVHPKQIEHFVYKMGDPRCPDGARQELAKALILIDPEKGKAEFDKYYDYIKSNPPRPEKDNAEVLARLDSVKSIIDQAK
jgi:hypothetical protein